MSKHIHQQTHRGFESLAGDARALLAATADIAGAKVGEARKRLSLALESAKSFAGDIRDKTVAGARATDKVVRRHPYKSMAIALGTGALVGCALASRRASRDS